MANPKSIPQWGQFLGRWLPLTGFSGLTFFFVSSHQIGNAIATALCALVLFLWNSFRTPFQEEVEKEMKKLVGKLVPWFFQLLYRLGSIVQEWAIQFWWTVSFNFTGKYYKRLDILCREFETKGMTLDKVLSLQNIFVTVHLSSKNLVQVSPNLLKKIAAEDSSQQLEGKEIGHYLALMQKYPEFRRLAILGAPGSGKTTLMRYLALMYASRQPRRLHPKAPQWLPVLLYLRDIEQKILKKPEIPLEELLTEWVQELQRVNPLKLPENWFKQQLSQGKCLVLLDGLDEVANTAHRQAVSQWVDQQMYEYSDTPFILTSRRLGYEEAQLKLAVQVLEVEPLRFEQIKQFVSNWYWEVECIRRGGHNDLGTKDAAYRNTENLLTQVKEHQALRDLASNPLLLTLIVTAHQQNQSIPLRRVELYQTICEVMLGKRQEAKGIRSQLSIRDKLSVLQPLALELMQRQTRQFQLSEVETLFTEHLAKLPNPPETLDFLKQLQAVDALIAKDREGDYEFAHLSFQEYLAAVEVKETKQEEIFLNVLQNRDQLSWWAETMRLYVAQTDATQLVEAIVQESKTWQEPDFEKLFLAWDFCHQGRVGPVAKQGLSNYTNEPLKVLDAEDYQYAVSKQPCYFKLAYFLQTRQWKEADREIIDPIRQGQNSFGFLDIKNFSYSDLRVIDQLWLKYSNGHFGLSVQKQIWIEVGGKLDYGDDFKAAYESFIKLSEQLEWRKDGRWVNYNDLVWDISLAPKAYLPYCNLVKFTKNKRVPVMGLLGLFLSSPDL